MPKVSRMLKTNTKKCVLKNSSSNMPRFWQSSSAQSGHNHSDVFIGIRFTVKGNNETVWRSICSSYLVLADRLINYRTPTHAAYLKIVKKKWLTEIRFANQIIKRAVILLHQQTILARNCLHNFEVENLFRRDFESHFDTS